MSSKTKILVTGSHSILGSALITALQICHGDSGVIAVDNSFISPTVDERQQAKLLNRDKLESLISDERITQIYLLPAPPELTKKLDSESSLQTNIAELVSMLSAASGQCVKNIFWASGTDVFGPGSPKHRCPQENVGCPATAHGISRLTGEYWCKHYFEQHGLDVRSIRLPGLIWPIEDQTETTAGFASEMIRCAIDEMDYPCYLEEDTCQPFIYLHDAVRAMMELMSAPAERLTVRTSYNLSAMSFSPCDLAAEIRKYLPGFRVIYKPDIRQVIANSLPASFNDQHAKNDWGWKHAFGLSETVAEIFLRRQAEKAESRNQPAPAFDDQYCFIRIDEA